MPRAALMTVVLTGLLSLTGNTRGAEDPHLDPGLVPGGCVACHQGHGASGSPMLPRSQVEMCLSCHGSRAAMEQKVNKGLVSPNARPLLLSRALAQPSVHFLSREAFSSDESGAVTCTSCHSPHRGMQDRGPAVGPPGRALRSAKDPARYEYELCEECHGNAGVAAQDPLDLSRLLNPGNRSYHPIEALPLGESPSIQPEIAGRQINCTDCHGNADPGAPRGPHGSRVPFILKYNYTTVDGGSESASAYALCYTCHDRDAILFSNVFPEHRRHIVEERASCATCHNAHGSVANRSLIRFGEELLLAGVSPSLETGRLAFVSDGPGSGACYLTCHGYDHAPEAYGGLDWILESGANQLPSGSVGLPRGIDRLEVPRKPVPDGVR